MVPFGNHFTNFITNKLFSFPETLQDLLGSIENFELRNICLKRSIVRKIKRPGDNNIAIPFGVEPRIIHIPKTIFGKY